MADGESDVRDYRSLGEILREAREKKGWSLEELHEHTRIAPRMVQALEADDIDQFDSPVYARGFVRQLAGPLGLDPDWLLTKLGVPQRSADDAPAEVLPVDPPATPPSPAVPPTAPPVSERGPVWEVEAVRVRKVEVDTGGGLPWRGMVAALVVLSLVVAGAYLVRSFSGDGRDAANTAPAPATESSRSIEPSPREPEGVGETAEATPEAAETGRELVAERVEADPARAADAGLEWHPSTEPAEIERATAPRSAPDTGAEETLETVTDDEPEATPAEPETPAPEAIEDDETSAVTRSAPVRGGRERNEVVKSEGLDRGLPSVVRGETTPAETPMRLVVTARSRVEIDITRSDGTRERRTLEAGEQWTLTGTDHFLVRASDPAAADFELDGILRDPPPRWSGREWFLHRPNDDGSR